MVLNRQQSRRNADGAVYPYRIQNPLSVTGRPGSNPGGAKKLHLTDADEVTTCAAEGATVRPRRKHGPPPKSSPAYIVDPATGCWIWQRTKTQKGYGLAWNGTRTVPAHRMVYERDRAIVPDGMQLDHLCRTRLCVNPDHLEVVTSAINNRRSSLAKLTPEKAEAIRQRSLAGEVGSALAKEFGVTPKTIRDIASGLTWGTSTHRRTKTPRRRNALSAPAVPAEAEVGK